MSAILLRRLEMDETTRHLFHATVTELRGQAWADLMFGSISPISPLLGGPFYSGENSEHSCARCFVDLTQAEVDVNVSRYKGQAAFYLCDCCQQEAFLAPEDAVSSANPVLTLKCEED